MHHHGPEPSGRRILFPLVSHFSLFSSFFSHISSCAPEANWVSDNASERLTLLQSLFTIIRMKSYFQATAFLLALSSLCLASITVPTPSTLSSANIVSAAGSTGISILLVVVVLIADSLSLQGHDHVSITFNVPCPDCLSAKDNGLVRLPLARLYKRMLTVSIRS